MKTLTDPELKFLQDFIEEVLVICHNDYNFDFNDYGHITFGLDKLALTAGEILGLKKEDMESLE